MPAATSVVRLTVIEIVTLTPLLEADRRNRVVPPDAERASDAVVIALVEVLLTMVVIEPEQAPVDSVQVPEQLCIAIVSGEIA